MAKKTCVITGGSKGIGLATALRLAHDHYDVVLAARNEADLLVAAQKVQRAGAQCLAVVADVARPDDARRVIDEAAQRFGRVDVLVNNAGVAPLIATAEMDTAMFDQTVQVNMAAVFHTTQAVWGVMKARGGGVIVNISSLASLDPFPGFAVYGASKAWVNLFSRAVAREGKPLGIRVYAVAPGAVETNMMRTAFPDFPADKALEPQAVADVITLLCRDEMTPCTGETIFVQK